LPEDGDLEMRAGVLEFIDIRLSDAARQVPLTEYDADGGHSVPSRSFSLLDRMTMAAAGTVDDFNAAVEYTSTPHLQGLSANFRDVRLALENLKAVANRLLADLAPRFEKLEAALAECRRLVQWSLTLRGQPEFPVEAPPAEVSGPVPAPLAPETVSLSPEPAAAPSGPSPLERAEELVRAGHLQEALTELAAATAANETGGDRFRRKLLVADVCMRTRRTNLAIAVLEELSAEIDHFHLDQWESPQLVGRVWSQLLECYFSSNMESHVDQIRPLLARLCRLDPTQALDFESYMGRYAIRTPAS
ncbi:MAG: type VI secretion system domain-containing protein, partial [Candidatus Solibacter sp.]|nr:type VI secretion system domain-containing protein [Candidatus Solibacter sp.]